MTAEYDTEIKVADTYPMTMVVAEEIVRQGYANPDGKHPNVSRDFFAQGVANLATSFVGGMPAGGSISGTAVLMSAGARSRLANSSAGVFVALIVLLAAPLVELVPMPALAALLIVAGFQGLRLREAVAVWNTGRVSAVIMIITFVSTLFIPLQYAVLLGMVLSVVLILYTPFLVLSIVATVIASQAMISGIFSIVYQGITTHIMPVFKVDYTSAELRSQIYVGFVNWFLLVAVLVVMVEFREASRLAAAYGLAVTGTMTLTGIMMIWIFYLRGRMFYAAVSVFVTVVDIVFLLSNSYKIPHGGYWSIIIASIPFAMIILYTSGQKRLYSAVSHMDRDIFLEEYAEAYKSMNKIKGTALFFARDISKIDPYIVRTMFKQTIIYEDNIIVTLIRLDDPFGVSGMFKETLADGLRRFEIRMGYMTVINVEEILRRSGH